MWVKIPKRLDNEACTIINHNRNRNGVPCRCPCPCAAEQDSQIGDGGHPRVAGCELRV